jgi:hypothetical protein
MNVAVIGDSYMSATVRHKGLHFTEILAERLGWRLHTVARGGSTNNVIRSQIDYVINVVKPDFAFVGTTFQERLEIPIEGCNYQTGNGLLNFNYDRRQYGNDQSYYNLATYPTMEFDAISSFIGQDGQPIFDNALTEYQRLILKNFYIHNFSSEWKIQLDTWVLQSGFHALEQSNIKFAILLQNYLKMYSTYRDLEYFEKYCVDMDLCPWAYETGPFSFHTTAETQVILADKWQKFFERTGLSG